MFDNLHLTNMLRSEVEHIPETGLPLDAFPDRIQEIILNLARYENFNIEYTSSIILSAVATAVGNACHIHIKGERKSCSSLYMMLVGRPGLGKTPPLGFIYKPINEQDDKMFEKYNDEWNEYERAIATSNDRHGSKITCPNCGKSRCFVRYIDEDGKIHPLGYHSKSLEVRLQERLAELGWKPFKPNSKIQPNCCAKFIFGGNHNRTLEMAFGDQAINLEKGADNNHLHRCEEVEHWAKDIYDWCARRYGQENIIGFQIHLDETSPHIHALIVPVGVRPKSGRQCVMWSAKFGKDRFEYGTILKDMHTSLYEEVGSKYGLERGDSIDGRNVEHLNKRDYIRKLTKEAKQAERAVKGLQTMIRTLESSIFRYKSQLEEINSSLSSGKLALKEYETRKADIEKQIFECQAKLEDKAGKLHEKELALTRLSKDLEKAGSVIQPFRNHKLDFEPPRISGKVPLFGTDKWLESQNEEIARQFSDTIHQIETLYRSEAERQVKTAQHNALADYREFYQLRRDVSLLSGNNEDLKSTLETILDQLAIPSIRSQVFTIADALIGGTPIPVSSGGGGSTSDLRWDGRQPDEEEEAYRRRCLMYAIGMVKRSKRQGTTRKI